MLTWKDLSVQILEKCKLEIRKAGHTTIEEVDRYLLDEATRIIIAHLESIRVSAMRIIPLLFRKPKNRFSKYFSSIRFWVEMIALINGRPYEGDNNGYRVLAMRFRNAMLLSTKE